ncbi:hypothetical protein ACQW02_25415 [Humitalea sp. 24SJ18S-53]|uniref:hypothetical protein n=1 Tax=Humitalea sp. 24SJ18S-53 TaxID=3422307 RepID=UPI003D668DFE
MILQTGAEALLRDRAIMRTWPASLVEIAEVIGIAASLRLVDAYGGTTLYVPAHAEPTHRLVQSIGREAAALLIERYTREKIEVPTVRMARSRKVLIAGASGPTHEVARTLGVTARWVRMVRNMGRPDPRQIDMFAARVED